MKAVVTLSLITLITSPSTAQLFPFSNLQKYLAKNKSGGNGAINIQNNEQSTARPYRHTDSHSSPKLFDLTSIQNFGPGDTFSSESKDDLSIERPNRNTDTKNIPGLFNFPPIPSFGHADIFSQERKEKQSTERPYRDTHSQSSPKVFDLTSPNFDYGEIFSQQPKEDEASLKQEDSLKEDKVIKHTQQKRRRKPIRSSTEKPEQRKSSDVVLVTPKPVYRVQKPKHNTGDVHHSKSVTTKPNNFESFSATEESGRVARPVQYGSMQINTNEEPVLIKLPPKQYKNSKREENVESTSELSHHSKEPILVESIPSLHFAVEQTQYKPNTDGLVDYLTPPKLPSIYSSVNNLNPQDFYSDTDDDVSSRLSKLNPPPPTPAKKIKYRIKKYRLKPTHGPVHPVRIRKPKAEPQPPVPYINPDKITVENVGNEENAHIGSGQGKSTRQITVGSQLDEQITAETGFTGVATANHGSDQRVEFQMHGQSGPESYKFGYDTGKGHNRQFRFEEKDNHGHIKGHYGYYDKTGKLQVVNYEADPEHGFKADTV